METTAKADNKVAAGKLTNAVKLESERMSMNAELIKQQEIAERQKSEKRKSK